MKATGYHRSRVFHPNVVATQRGPILLVDTKPRDVVRLCGLVFATLHLAAFFRKALLLWILVQPGAVSLFVPRPDVGLLVPCAYFLEANA